MTKSVKISDIQKLAIPALISGIAEPILSITDTIIVGNIPENDRTLENQTCRRKKKYLFNGHIYNFHASKTPNLAKQRYIQTPIKTTKKFLGALKTFPDNEWHIHNEIQSQ